MQTALVTGRFLNINIVKRLLQTPLLCEEVLAPSSREWDERRLLEQPEVHCRAEPHSLSFVVGAGTSRAGHWKFLKALSSEAAVLC